MTTCPHCAAALGGSEQTLHALYDKIELPRPAPVVTRVALYAACCPRCGARVTYRYTRLEGNLRLRRYWTSVCQSCAIKAQCTPATERRITRWEHEHVLEEVQRRLDEHPERMRQRRETVEHPFGTIKCWMGYTGSVPAEY